MSQDNEFEDLEQMRRRLEETGGLPFSELLPVEKVAEALAIRHKVAGGVAWP